MMSKYAGKSANRSQNIKYSLLDDKENSRIPDRSIYGRSPKNKEESRLRRVPSPLSIKFGDNKAPQYAPTRLKPNPSALNSIRMKTSLQAEINLLKNTSSEQTMVRSFHEEVDHANDVSVELSTKRNAYYGPYKLRGVFNTKRHGVSPTQPQIEQKIDRSAEFGRTRAFSHVDNSMTGQFKSLKKERSVDVIETVRSELSQEREQDFSSHERQFSHMDLMREYNNIQKKITSAEHTHFKLKTAIGEIRGGSSSAAQSKYLMSIEQNIKKLKIKKSNLVQTISKIDNNIAILESNVTSLDKNNLMLREELIRLRQKSQLALNLKSSHQDLERKTSVLRSLRADFLRDLDHQRYDIDLAEEKLSRASLDQKLMELAYQRAPNTPDLLSLKSHISELFRLISSTKNT